jgi:hypothetical protein
VGADGNVTLVGLPRLLRFWMLGDGAALNRLERGSSLPGIRPGILQVGAQVLTLAVRRVVCASAFSLLDLRLLGSTELPAVGCPLRL